MPVIVWGAATAGKEMFTVGLLLLFLPQYDLHGPEVFCSAESEEKAQKSWKFLQSASARQDSKLFVLLR